MAFSWKRWTRKLHRWGAVITFVPLLLVVGSGLLLQMKKQLAWIQPPTTTGSSTSPEIPWQTILEATANIPETEVHSWADVDRVDVRPGKGIAKVQCINRWEVQIDLTSGKVLSVNYRRSDLIESLHDGSFFSDTAKLSVFLPTGLILLGLWCSGAYLWWLPFGAKRKKRKLAMEAS
jgi:uncharacterized iron-regulated membrane protein